MKYTELVIINPKSTSAKNILSYIQNKQIDYIISTDSKQLVSLLKNKITKGYNTFIICGGDGSINNFVNAYMKLSSNKRKDITLGIIPCGKANDLARVSSISLNINEAYNQIKKHRIKYIDLVKVNDKYYITGGGLGLPTAVVQDVNKFTIKFGFVNKIIKDLVYYGFVIKNLLFNYSDVEDIMINSNKYNGKFMLVTILNQSFIGKRFNLSPNANNNDGKINLCLVPKKNVLADWNIIKDIIKGRHINNPQVVNITGKKFIIHTKHKMDYMADGELICNSDTFNISVIPKTIKILY